MTGIPKIENRSKEMLPTISKSSFKYAAKFKVKPGLSQAKLLLNKFGDNSKIHDEMINFRQEKQQKLDEIFHKLHKKKTIKDRIRYEEVVNKNDDHLNMFMAELKSPEFKRKMELSKFTLKPSVAALIIYSINPFN